MMSRHLATFRQTRTISFQRVRLQANLSFFLWKIRILLLLIFLLQDSRRQSCNKQAGNYVIIITIVFLLPPRHLQQCQYIENRHSMNVIESTNELANTGKQHPLNDLSHLWIKGRTWLAGYFHIVPFTLCNALYCHVSLTRFFLSYCPKES